MIESAYLKVFFKSKNFVKGRFGYWILLISWCGALYIVFINSIIWCIMCWKINKEMLFMSIFLRKAGNSAHKPNTENSHV